MNMDMQTQKEIIIEQINQISDINLINTIKSMLDFALNKKEEYDVSEENKYFVQEHVEKYKNNPEAYVELENLEKDLKLELKSDLHRLIVESNDTVILTQIHEYFKHLNTKNKDWWLSLTPEQQKKIQKGVDQLDSGEGILHEKVRKSVNKLLSQYE